MCFRLDMLGSRLEWNRGGEGASEQWAAAERKCVREVEVMTMTTSPSPLQRGDRSQIRFQPRIPSASHVGAFALPPPPGWLVFFVQGRVYLSERGQRGAALTVDRCVHANGKQTSAL